MQAYWDLVEQIIRESDIVLEILDARLVEFSRNPKLEELIKKIDRPRIFVINKMDLISDTKKLEKEADKLKESEKSDIVYVTIKHRKSIKILLGKIKQVFSKYGKRKNYVAMPMIERPYREARGDVIVGIVGYPNVGKSTIINGLTFKNKVKVSRTAGTTHGIHWINASDGIKFIDTPGVIPLEKIDDTRLGLISARNPERIKEPDVVAFKIIDMFVKENKLDNLKSFYHLELGEEKDPSVIIEKIALKRNFVLKKGLPDENRASLLIIGDWQTGKLKL